MENIYLIVMKMFEQQGATNSTEAEQRLQEAVLSAPQPHTHTHTVAVLTQQAYTLITQDSVLFCKYIAMQR